MNFIQLARLFSNTKYRMQRIESNKDKRIIESINIIKNIVFEIYSLNSRSNIFNLSHCFILSAKGLYIFNLFVRHAFLCTLSFPESQHNISCLLRRYFLPSQFYFLVILTYYFISYLNKCRHYSIISVLNLNCKVCGISSVSWCIYRII